MANAGGFKHFGPTYPTTDYVRLGYEGELNGIHQISPTLVAAAQSANGEANAELAGSFAAMANDGVTTAADGGADAIGLFREDLHDMVNASGNATFYFRGGEYYVQETRLADGAYNALSIGDSITAGANGKIRKAESADRVLGTVTHKGEFTNGNMYVWGATCSMLKRHCAA